MYKRQIPTCPDCGADSPNEDERRTMDIVDELSLLATRTSANVSLVSLDSEEGATLANSFGGIAAILRYPWN